MSHQHPSQLSILDFTYELPSERIARYPLQERDESKILVYKEGKILENKFSCLSEYLEAGTLLVFNKTKVIRARLNFKNSKSQAIELFCLEPSGSNSEISLAMGAKRTVRWNCLVGNLRQWKEKKIKLEQRELCLNAEIKSKENEYVVIEFNWTPKELSFSEVIERLGNTPIPPYLKRVSEEIDEQRYQTIYAKKEGSVAAPTAGLHFTEKVMKQLQENKISFLSLTLHVSAGTFKQVKAEKMEHHNMHAEVMEVSLDEIKQLNDHKGKLIAVGTTSLRTLESLYWMGVKVLDHHPTVISELEVKQWDPYELKSEYSRAECLEALVNWMMERKMEKLVCHTAILLAPPYQLKISDGLVTNFHQPQSTLLLLVSSIVGDKWREIYQYALDHQFRFLSYGDSSLLLK